MKNLSLIMRGFISVVLIAVWSWLSTLWSAVAITEIGTAGVNQFKDSDAAFVQTSMIVKFFNGGVLPGIILAALLLWVWWSPLAKLKNYFAASAIVILAVLGTVQPTPSYAYYDTTNRAEWVEVGANQSAFLIPVVGASKDKQAKFGSIEFLNASKVAAKRVEIHHVVADNTGTFKDKWVPAEKLFLLDRTPFTREWATSPTKGTSAKAEGFRFESADSLTIETSITISALVTEEDAAKFFYWFGTNAQKQSQSPEEVFASVAYGRSLADVMDTVVRGRVQAALSKEFGKMKLIAAIGNKAPIIDAVEAIVKKEFADKGITILYLGYADELTIAPDLQKVLNDQFVLTTKLANRDAYMTMLDIDRQQAEINVKNAQGTAINKWNGTIPAMPSFLAVGDNFLSSIGKFFKDTFGTAEPAKK